MINDMLTDIHDFEFSKQFRTNQAVGLWSRDPNLQPGLWLKNFDPDQRPIAARILSRLVFVNNEHTDELLRKAIRRLIGSRLPGLGFGPKRTAKIMNLLLSWRVTPLLGEQPNPSDSGFLICRRLRDRLGIDENVIVDMQTVAAFARKDRLICLVDDFIGSGDQVIDMWKSSKSWIGAAGETLEAIENRTGVEVSIVCAVATKSGTEAVQKHTKIRVFAGQTIDGGTSGVGGSPGTATWDADVVKLLRATAPRLDLSEKPFLQTDDQAVFGFRRMALTLLFQHGAPDSTLPILWAAGNDLEWAPLWRPH